MFTLTDIIEYFGISKLILSERKHIDTLTYVYVYSITLHCSHAKSRYKLMHVLYYVLSKHHHTKKTTFFMGFLQIPFYATSNSSPSQMFTNMYPNKAVMTPWNTAGTVELDIRVNMTWYSRGHTRVDLVEVGSLQQRRSAHYYQVNLLPESQ